MPMTAAQSLSRTPDVIKGRAAGSRVSGRNPRMANFKGKKVPVLKAVVRSSGTGDPHVCTVVALEEKQLHEAKVVVDCDCDFFTFNCEYALAKKGAAVIRRSNGEPPDVKNPRYIPYCCKHLVVVLGEILKNQV